MQVFEYSLLLLQRVNLILLFGVVSDYVEAKSKSLTCILTKQSFVFNTT